MSTRIRAALVLSSAALLVDAVLYAVAIESLLSTGPSAFGYDALAAANRSAALVAVLVASAGVLLAAQGRRVTAWLIATSVATLVGSVGLRSLGLWLADIEPTRQPLDLNSLLLAMIGTGSDLTAVPIVLGVAAVVTVLISRRRARGARSTAQPA